MLILSLSFCSAQPAPTCIDSDNGLNYYLKGTIYNEVYPNGITDFCYNTNYPIGQLAEYFCNGSMSSSYTNYICPNGCSNGACINITSTCIDSDGGLNYNTKGKTWNITRGNGNEDFCALKGDNYAGEFTKIYSCTTDNFQCFLKEFTCIDEGIKKGAVTEDFYKCPNGCANGHCITENAKTCSELGGIKCSYSELCRGTSTYDSIDTDRCCIGQCVTPVSIDSETEISCSSSNGEDYNTKGTTIRVVNSSYNSQQKEYSNTDTCIGEDLSVATIAGPILVKYSCNGDGKEVYRCPNGCYDGACLGSDKTFINANITTGSVEVTNTNTICGGCMSDNKCYPFGYRKNSQFCSDNGNFIDELNEDKSCENNFECSSNFCVSGKCISEGFLQKVLSWFRRLFGAE